jgi:multiple sugar transport system substrate-binding protein
MDMFFMDVIWCHEFASAGWLLDLTSRFNAVNASTFFSGPLAACTLKGRLYGVPSFLDAGLLFLRKDLLHNHGFNPPRTWNEMVTQGQTIIESARNAELHTYSAQFKQYEGLVCNMMEFIWSKGGQALVPETGKVSVAEPPVLEAITFVRDQIIDGAAPRGVLGYEEPESLALFVQGKAVFHRNWPYAWTVANDPNRSRVSGKVSLASLPAFDGHAPASALGGWQFGISRWSRQPDAACRFIDFMSSFESQKILALEAGLAPARKAVYRDPEVQANMPHLVMFLPIFEKARPRPLSPIYPMISQELQRFFSRSISEPGSNVLSLATETARRIEKFGRMGIQSRE